ncbi:MAG: sigma 54-interacting transcriptional regulator [Methylococcaceae bacterium]|nr:sigma 54-interacting transcriptional regulator [Methylococcaceae bacterium]
MISLATQHSPIRNILVFSSGECTDWIHEALKSRNWCVFIAHTLDQAHDLMKIRHFYAGLCIIDEHIDLKQLDQMQCLFEYSAKTKWVLGIPKDFLLSNRHAKPVIRLLARYCYDYVSMPVCINRLLLVLERTYSMAYLAFPEYQHDSEVPACRRISGERYLYRQIEKIARHDDSVLIQGDFSLGMGQIAEAIHHHSWRSEFPLITIKCGVYSDNWMDAELFGYKSAILSRSSTVGRIEAAQNGTLFFDEVSHLSKRQQASLLCFIEKRKVASRRDDRKLHIDTRIIAGTHKTLESSVREGMFRADLYYRLRELQIVPSARYSLIA